jgi:hypothetical protein
MLGHPVAGIVGVDALAPFVVQLDVDSGRLRFLAPDAAGHADWGTREPMPINSRGIPTVRAAIDGQAADFWVDTGHSGGGFLPEWWVDRLAKTSKTVTETAASFSGESEYRSVRVRDLAVAGFHHLDKLIVSSSELPQPGLGIEFFLRYVATFDFPHHALYLRRGKRFDVRDEHSMSGVYVRQEPQGMVVRHVDADSPGALAGVRVGDVLLEVDGAAVKDIDIHDLRKRLVATDGAEIRLRLSRDGSVHDVRFRARRAI